MTILTADSIETARRLAMQLNCGCGTCPTCTKIEHSMHIDVIEVSKANVEKYLSSIHYGPAVARYKVYIVTEKFKPLFDDATIPDSVVVLFFPSSSQPPDLLDVI